MPSALFLLAAGTLLPLAIFAIAAIDLLVQHERDTVKRDATGRVVSALTAVDAELRGSIAALQALAASENLQTGDLRAFHDEARRALASQPIAFCDLTESARIAKTRRNKELEKKCVYA